MAPARRSRYDEEQVQRIQASTGQDWRRRSRIRRWSSQLNCAGVRRRHLGAVARRFLDHRGLLDTMNRGPIVEAGVEVMAHVFL